MSNALCYTFNNATGKFTPGIVVRRILYKTRGNGLETWETSGLKVGQTVERCDMSGFSGSPREDEGRALYNSNVTVGPPKDGPCSVVIVETGDEEAGFRLFHLDAPLNFETVASEFNHREATEADWTWRGHEDGFFLDRGYVIFLDANRALRAVPLPVFLVWLNEAYVHADASLLALATQSPAAAS